MNRMLLSLFILLYITSNKIKALTKNHNADRMAEVVVLELAQKPISASELAILMGIKLSAMSQKINAMQKRGLLQRQESTDARKNLTVITQEGRVYLDQAVKCIPDNCPTPSIGLNQSEITQLYELLSKLKLT